MVEDEVDRTVYVMMLKAHESQRASFNQRMEFWNKYPKLKNACKLFWTIKGHLPLESTILASADGYFKRLWHNEESYIHEKGWEEAFFKFIEKNYVLKEETTHDH